MSALCGLCKEQISKYKCPTCQVPYCSLACYKPHKVVHTETQETAPVGPVDDDEAQEIELPPPRGYKSWPPDFYALPANPEFQSLMKQYPNLKLQLGRIFLQTLEPLPQETRGGGFRRGGRGGRGFRGGRGGAGSHQKKWSRETGDKNATRVLQKIEDDTSVEGDGMREFVALVARLYEKEEDAVS